MMTWPTGFSENCWTEDVWVHKPAKEVKKKCFSWITILSYFNPQTLSCILSDANSDLSFKMKQKLLNSGQDFLAENFDLFQSIRIRKKQVSYAFIFMQISANACAYCVLQEG